MALRIELFGIECNTGAPDANGCRWTVSTPLDGWESPKQDSQRAQLSSRHGETWLNRRFGARVLTVKGSVRAPSDEAAWAAYNQIAGSMPGLLGSGTIVVHEPIPKMVTAEQDDKPWIREPRSGYFKFELTLACLRPFKRGLSAREVAIGPGASATVTNAGNFAAPVDVKTTTAGTVKLRQGTSGAVMRTRVSVGSGTKFDAANRTVRSAAGLDVYDVMASPSEWLSVARESTVTVTNQGTATVELTIYDTYA